MSLSQKLVRYGAALVLAVSAPLAGASLVSYSSTLSGAAEAPPNGSAGSGAATLLIDTLARSMTLDVNFGGLTGNVTAAHIHCCVAVAGAGTAGVATQVPTFAGFPAGVTAGTYHQVFDLDLASTWNPTYVTNNGGTVALAADAFLAGLDVGRAYLNIHTNAFPGGEIRGFLSRDVPEPALPGLLGVAAACGWLVRRRRTG